MKVEEFIKLGKKAIKNYHKRLKEDTKNLDINLIDTYVIANVRKGFFVETNHETTLYEVNYNTENEVLCLALYEVRDVVLFNPNPYEPNNQNNEEEIKEEK